MNAYNLESPERKLVMWYKCNEKKEKGLTKAQIARELGLDVKTVRKYLRMSYDEFKSSESYKRMYIKVLDPYESKVSGWLDDHQDLSSSQVHDWLRERYPDLPDVNSKTVYNYVKYIRAKYNIEKPILSAPRQYARLEETAYGEYAQVDFGEMWMQYEDKRKVKVYFFVMVLCRSRKKYAWFSKSPFTSDLAIYAHEKAFEYFGGKPKKIIYDQDAVLIHAENLGDYVLTKAFNAYVNQAHFQCIFCRKADPESKGKVENAVKYVLDPSHRKTHPIALSTREQAILEYCNYDTLAQMWLENLRADKARYYKTNVRTLSSEMRHFEPSTLHNAFEKSLDCGMYNAKDFISLCDRIGKRIPVRDANADRTNRLSDIINETPEKTDVKQYNQYFS